MNDNVKNAILSVIQTLMDRVMDKVLITDPFVVEKFHAQKPLYAALVPDEIFKGSHFERRFVTPFGNVWEKLALEVANAYHGHCEQGATIQGTVGEESLRRIQEVLNRLEHPVRGKKREKPNWCKELEYVKAGGGVPIPVVNICLGEHEVEQLASFVAYKMQFETEMPPHGTLAGLGIIMKYLVSFNALVVAYGNACAVNETYARASYKTKQLEKQHHLQGDSGF